MEKRDALKVWTILLAILAFSLSLIGTFLVRSGVLTSVHAFATDPTRGIFILAILVLFIGGALALFAWRAPLLKQGGLFAPISREGALVLNNLFLTTRLRHRVRRHALSARARGADRREDFGRRAVLQRDLRPAVRAAAAGDAVRAAARLEARRSARRRAAAAGGGDARRASRSRRPSRSQHGGPVLAPFGVGLAVFVMAGALTDIVERTMILRVPLGAALRRAAGLPRSAWGTAFAHFGLGVTLLGIVVVTAWGSERIAALKPGEAVDIAHYRLTFDGMSTAPARTIASSSAVSPCAARAASDRRHGAEPAQLSRPQHGDHRGRADDARREPALSVARRSQPDGRIAVRLYYKPLVLLIWLGAVIMFVGGALSLSDRRLRVGAPRPAKARPPRRCSRRSDCREAIRVDLHAADRVLLRSYCAAPRAAAAPCSPTRCCQIPRSRRARARCRGSCAAWCARTSRSTIPRRRWRAICASWCASGSRPATATRRCSIFWSRATASSCCSSRRCRGTPLLLWGLPPAVLLLGVRGAARRRQRRRRARPPAAEAREPHRRRGSAAVRTPARRSALRGQLRFIRRRRRRRILPEVT